MKYKCDITEGSFGKDTLIDSCQLELVVVGAAPVDHLHVTPKTLRLIG